MDRLLLKRSLIAVSGLALMVSATGCRDRNLNVPPPAHYTDGVQSIPEAAPYPGYPPMSSDSTAIDPYARANLGTPRTFDPATTQTSGVSEGMGHSPGSPAAPTYAPSAGFGVPPVSGLADPVNASGPFASPSSPNPYAADPYTTGAGADPYAGMNTGQGASSFMPPAGTNGDTSLPVPNQFPGLDGLNSTPPIPDRLPEMP
ncbi:hypothetical protein [Tautonia rosea]|uniref:hypothetical protein n=1 Tax=Tautonia rosea TaxID=2728037 RepID=UPI001474D703|nr:hypothetical protein [Tautonia rosea]